MRAKLNLLTLVTTSLTALLLTACGSSGGGSGSPAAATPGNNLLPYPLTSGPAANGDRVRISSIDGRYSATHATDLNVRPGDVVTLSADVFVGAQSLTPAGRPPESFVWSSSLGAQDTCNASQPADCLQHSNFQITNYGVAYYVPRQMPAVIQVVVTSLDPQEVDAQGHRVFDTVVLHNMDFGGQTPAPPSVLSDLTQYPEARIDYDVALAGMGDWVNIEGVRYFVPHTYVMNGETEWAPLRHGNWVYDQQFGFTFVSFDPWETITAHYGVWRHHHAYGWIWESFAKEQYVPTVASFLNQESYIGFYPYSEQYVEIYRAHGEAEGFDDGFWLGAQLGANFGAADFRYHPGFAFVAGRDFLSVNLTTVLIERPEIYTPFVRSCFSQNHVFATPGGGNFSRSLEFVRRLTGGGQVPMTNVSRITSRGGATFMQPGYRPQVPAETRTFEQRLKTMTRPMPLGSVMQIRGSDAKILPPTSNFRSPAPTPVLRDEKGQVLGAAPMRATHPGVPTAGNSVGENGARSATTTPALDLKQLPAFDPRAKTPEMRLPGDLDRHEAKHEPTKKADASSAPHVKPYRAVIKANAN